MKSCTQTQTHIFNDWGMINEPIPSLNATSLLWFDVINKK